MRLDIQNLRGGYGKRNVLEDINLAVAPGGVTALLGPNGCGKSTLLRMIGRVLRPEGGRILIDGADIDSIDTLALARRLALQPQAHPESTGMTVEELISLGRYPHRGCRALSREDLRAVNAALKLTGSDALRKRAVDSLSGGERQKVWIALAVAQEPQLLLLDEPTTALDLRCQFEIIGLVRKLNCERGVTVVMVLHDINLAARSADRVAMIKDGRIRFCGPPAAAVTPENIREIFGVESSVVRLNGGVPFCITLGVSPAAKPDEKKD